jgi:hypothetical protein
MAIETEQESVQIKTIKRSWRINLENPWGGESLISIFRETIRQLADGTVIQKEQSTNPINVPAKELADLAPYCQLSQQAKDLLEDPDEETLKKYLAMMPLITSIACDAAERRHEEQAQQQAQAQAQAQQAPPEPPTETPTEPASDSP